MTLEIAKRESKAISSFMQAFNKYLLRPYYISNTGIEEQ